MESKDLEKLYGKKPDKEKLNLNVFYGERREVKPIDNEYLSKITKPSITNQQEIINKQKAKEQQGYQYSVNSKAQNDKAKEYDTSAVDLRHSTTLTNTARNLYGGAVDMFGNLQNTSTYAAELGKNLTNLLPIPSELKQKNISALTKEQAKVSQNVYKTKGLSSDILSKVNYRNKAEELVGSAIQSVPNLAPYFVNPVLGVATTVGSSFGGEGYNAKQQGADMLTQVKAGTGSAIIETATELLGFKAIAKAITKNPVVKKQIVNAIESVVTNFGQEAAAEYLGFLNRKFTYDPNAEITSQDIVDAGLVGALMGGATPIAVKALSNKQSPSIPIPTELKQDSTSFIPTMDNQKPTVIPTELKQAIEPLNTQETTPQANIQTPQENAPNMANINELPVASGMIPTELKQETKPIEVEKEVYNSDTYKHLQPKAQQEIDSLIKQQANSLLNDLNSTFKAQAVVKRDNSNSGGAKNNGKIESFERLPRRTTKLIAELLDTRKWTYKDIAVNIQRVIDGKNTKRSKQLKDDLESMLANGYKDITGYKYPPDKNYIFSKAVFDPNIFDKYSYNQNTNEYEKPSINTEELDSYLFGDYFTGSNVTEESTNDILQNINIDELKQEEKPNRIKPLQELKKDESDIIEQIKQEEPDMYQDYLKIFDLSQNENTIDEAEKELERLRNEATSGKIPFNLQLFSKLEYLLFNKSLQYKAKYVTGDEFSDPYIQEIADIFEDSKMNNLATNTNDRRRIFIELKKAGLPVDKLESKLKESKKNYINLVNYGFNEVGKIQKLGIKEGSKEDAAIQHYGEGGIYGTDSNGKVEKISEYTLDNLKKDFPLTWEKIVSAEKITRAAYNNFIDILNKQLAIDYPDIEQKIDDFKEERRKLSTEVRRINDAKKASDNNYNAKISKLYEYNKAHTKASKQISENLNRIAILENKQIQERDKFDKSKQKAQSKIDKISTMLESGDLTRNKRIPYRKNYFSHFEDVQGLLPQISKALKSDINLDPDIASITEFTKPKSQWVAMAQRRSNKISEMQPFTASAIGGLKRYVPTMAKVVSFNREIKRNRNMAELIQQVQKATGTNKGTVLQNYFNNLADLMAGKTNKVDRIAYETLGKNETKGRNVINAIKVINNRVVKNSLLFNLGTATKQVLNTQNVMAYLKNPKYIADSVKELNVALADPNSPINNSEFLNERFLSRKLQKYDQKKLDKASNIGTLLMEVVDETFVKLSWQAFYEKKLNQLSKQRDIPLKNIKEQQFYTDEASDYADEYTAKSFASRNLFDQPLLEQGTLYKLIFPFTTEVSNQWRVLGDLGKDKDVLGFGIFLLASLLINKLVKEITGSDGSLDLLGSLYKGVTSDGNAVDKTINTVGGLTGEILSNMPQGKIISSLYDPLIANNQFLKGLGFKPTTRASFFGDEDPERYGGALFTNGFSDFFWKLMLPMGGGQAKKTVEALQSYGVAPQLKLSPKPSIDNIDVPGIYGTDTENKVYLKNPLATDPLSTAKTLLFGKYANPNSVKYFDEQLKNLTPTQTEVFLKLANKIGVDKLYQALLDSKNVSKKDEKIKIFDKIGNGEDIYRLLYPLKEK